ncbi:hypothetical protein [Leptospira sp. GIMC2001]|uniref:hypothetical protein n=1 Tax=Leptospira sp. GIMC2001 TaxID=1513297 RepID=UPI00234BE3CA|nr:hypothetical protein [Leptospira sp. GIMC2001]WCL50991.1 hypothetical protein O4O04_09320 [Leptospira sp. GIMC2001]
MSTTLLTNGSFKPLDKNEATKSFYINPAITGSESNFDENYDFDRAVMINQNHSSLNNLINKANTVAEVYKGIYIPYFITFRSEFISGYGYLDHNQLKEVIQDTFRELDILYFQGSQRKGLSFVKYTFPGFENKDKKYLPHFHTLIYLPRNRSLIIALEAIYKSSIKKFAEKNEIMAESLFWSKYYTSDTNNFFKYCERQELNDLRGIDKLDIQLSCFLGYSAGSRKLPNISDRNDVDLNLLYNYHKEKYESFATRIRTRKKALGYGLKLEDLLLPPDLTSSIKRNGLISFQREKLSSIRKILSRIFKNVFHSNDNLVHLINAKTGVGKTKLLEKIPTMLNDKVKRVLIVCLRIDNIDSIRVGHAYPNRPDILDIDDRIVKIKGLSRRRYYAELKRRNPDDPRVIAHTKFGIQVGEALNKYPILKITHKRFFSYFSQADMEKFDLIIFDECLIKARFNSDSIKINEIEILLEKIKLSNLSNSQIKKFETFCKRVKKTKSGYITRIPKFSEELLEKVENIIDEFQELKAFQYLSKEDTALSNISEKLNYFLNSRYFTRVGNSIEFIKTFDFPNKKIIILSGTPSETIYSQLFGERFVHYELPIPKIRAKIRQFGDFSFSKYNIKKNDNQYKSVINKYKKLGYAIITYKNKELEIDLNLGATESSNVLIGRNILIAGTMNPPVHYIRLISAELNLPYKTIKDYDKCKSEMHTYKGITFPYLAVSENITIRNIQFDFTSAILEQAVGRGRWSGYKVDIVIYSNFPCIHANYYVDDDYNLKNFVKIKAPLM